MAPTNRPTYLLKRPSGYHFRIKVPADLRDSIGKIELRRSLTLLTANAAQQEATRLAVLAKEFFQASRTRGSQKVFESSNSRDFDQLVSSSVTDQTLVINPVSEPDTLGAMIDEYCREQVQTGNWRPKTELENRAIYTLLLRILGDIPCQALTYPILRDFKAKLTQLPANLNKSPRYRDRTIEDILAMDCQSMSISNMNKHLCRISSLIRWGVKNGYLSVNVAEGLKLKRNIRQDQERPPFSAEELQRIFDHPLYRHCQAKKPYQYWLPILGLYTGARLNELCQLHVADISIREDIWTLDINNNTADKRLKTLSAARIIPLHSQLHSLGFLEFVTTAKELGEKRLFSELNLTRDGYGRSPSKWFSRFRRSVGLHSSDQKSPDFHSFRHTLSMKLRRNGYQIHDIAELLGHHNTSTTQRYTKRLSIQQLSLMIESIDYPFINELPSFPTTVLPPLRAPNCNH